MLIGDIVGVSVGILTIVALILGGTKIHRWTQQVEDQGMDIATMKSECGSCREKVQEHFHAAAIHRDPERDVQVMVGISARLENIERMLFDFVSKNNRAGA